MTNAITPNDEGWFREMPAQPPEHTTPVGAHQRPRSSPLALPQRPEDLPTAEGALGLLAGLVALVPAARSKVATLKHGREALKERIVGLENFTVLEGLEGSNETARKAFLGQKLLEDSQYQDMKALLEKDDLEIIVEEAKLETLEREWTWNRLLVEWKTAREGARAD